MYIKEMANFIKTIDFKTLPKEVIGMAKLRVIDWLGCVLKAKNTTFADSLVEIIKEEGGNERATVLGYWFKSSAMNSAFINGSMAHIIEFDDSYRDGLYHPAAPIVASALALGESKKINGECFLESVIAGYEIANRIAESVSPSHYNYFHSTGTCGTFGAAAAAAKILSLSIEEIISCIGFASTQASGLWECAEKSPISKPFHPGKAAMNGIMAALVAQKGIKSAYTTLEGKKGFCQVMSDEDKLYLLSNNLGEKYTILGASFKKYPTCGHTHSPLDVTLNLFKKHHFKKNDIKKIIVKTYKTACRVAGIKYPRDVYESKFSIYFALAVAVKFNCLNFDLVNQKVIEDPEIKQIIDKIELISLDSLEKKYPSKRIAIVEIELNNRNKYTGKQEYRKGDPENPLTTEEIKAKFEDLVTEILSSEKKKELWENLNSIETMKHINSLFNHIS